MATVSAEWGPALRDQSFERLYERYVRDVYQYALALLRNPADAEDVTQTTFMNAYRAMKRGEVPLKPQNWLIKIAHNAARTRYARQKARAPEVPLDDHVDTLAIPEEDKPDVQAVLDALAELPFNQRAALVMRELEGRSYAEIGELLGVSTSAVETLIFRARRGMRQRASAIRSLGAVPLPGSLSSLLGGGAGGGAILGAGFAAKATVAVVAGLLAGGAGYKAVDTTLAKPAPAAAQPAHVARVTPAERASRHRPVVASRPPKAATVQHGLSRSSRPAAAAAHPRRARHRDVSQHTGFTRIAHVASHPGRATRIHPANAGAGGASSGAAGQQTPSPAPAPVSSPAKTVTDTVTNVVSTATGALPSPPVQVPEPPPLPVAPPPLPATPPHVDVPQLPPPPVSLPPVPPPPSLPPLGP